MPFAPSIHLLVAESQAEQAKAILASPDQDRSLPEDWESQAEADVDGWKCHICDTIVEESATICQACQEPRKTNGTMLR